MPRSNPNEVPYLKLSSITLPNWMPLSPKDGEISLQAQMQQPPPPGSVESSIPERLPVGSICKIDQFNVYYNCSKFGALNPHDVMISPQSSLNWYPSSPSGSKWYHIGKFVNGSIAKISLSSYVMCHFGAITINTTLLAPTCRSSRISSS